MPYDRRRRLSSRAAAAVLCTALGFPAGADPLPAWWDNAIGTDPIVLPGFDPVEVSGSEVRLGGRRYVWEDSYLPTRIESLGRPLAGPLQLVATPRGAAAPLVLRPDRVQVASRGADHATVVADGEPLPGLRVVATTRVEYDGVALVTLELTPVAPIELDGLDFETLIERTPALRMLRFDAASVRYQPRKQTVALADYAGPFLNALGFPDGERSFWWFADDAEGWIWNGPTVTEVETRPDRVRLRQRLIGARWRITQPMRLRFNFLATPVRELGSAWRRTERVVASADRRHAGLGRFHLWWGSAFAHIDLPYTSYPPGVEEQLPEADRRAYPGLEANREMFQRFEREHGITRIPYFSTHCLSSLDPALQRHRSEWELDPPLVVKGGLAGLEAKLDKPCLSHRSRSFTNYLLDRFDEEVQRLGVPGLYFDQGPILDSKNPSHGWRDSRGRLQPALDILGVREFHKRLRVLFQRRGLPGYLFVHNSNSEIVPAYTFVTATLDGEQFRHHLKGTDDDYIAAISLDQARAQFAPGQYGVQSIWLPESWTLNAKDPEWEGSPAQRRSFRNFMTLALLHDVPVLPAGFPLDDWKALLRQLDDFGTDRATFRGYWSAAPEVAVRAEHAAVSYYRREDPARLLLVVANLDGRPRSLPLEIQSAPLGLGADASRLVLRALTSGETLPPGSPASVPVRAKDFELVLVEAGEPAEPAPGR